LGRVIFEEKLWGLGFVGGSLFLAFLILILSRIAFAATPRNISRNVNVILSPLFYSSMFGLIVGITNCWFVLIFRAHEDLYKEKLPIPFPGLFRKSLHLLGRKVPTGTNFQLVLKTVGLTFEAVTLANILMFVIASFILGISSTQQLDSSKTHTGYLGSSWVFGLSFTVFVLDAALAQGIHRYHGLKFRVPTEYTSWTMWNQDQQAGRTSREWKSGQDQSRMEQRDSLFLMRMLMAGQLLISLILRLVSGYCPYQDYHEDIYHGGDPAEQAFQDLASLIMLFSVSLFFARFRFREAFLYWKPQGFDKRPSDKISSCVFDHPVSQVHIQYSSLMCSMVLILLSVCILVVDTMYKLDAGM